MLRVMDGKTQILKHVFLSVLLVGWMWTVVAGGSLMAAGNGKNTDQPNYSHRTYKLLKIKRHFTLVHGASTKRQIKILNPAAITILRPPDAKPYWPARPSIDCAVLKCVALTFDDGPSTDTPPLLDLLKSKDVRATFFVVGLQIQKYPQDLPRMINEGHEIGNHTFHHKKLKTLLAAEVASEISSTQDLIYSVTGYRPHIMRPPMGEFTPGDPAMAQYPVILWNADPWDWKHRDSVRIDQEVMPQIKPGSIILLHDIYPTSINAVPAIIDTLKQQGYTFVTVSELFGWRDANAVLPNGQVLRGR